MCVFVCVLVDFSKNLSVPRLLPILTYILFIILGPVVAEIHFQGKTDFFGSGQLVNF